MRTVYVADSPLPYETAWLNEFSEVARLHVIYLASEHALYPFQDNWGEPARFRWSRYWSKSVRVRRGDVWAQFSLGISTHLRALNPDVVLCKSWQPLVIEPLLWAKAARRASLVWSESPSFGGAVRGTLSNTVRRSILSLADAFVTNGSQATAFLKDLGVHEERIISSALPSRAAERAYAAGASAERSAGNGEGPHFLFVGRLIPIKQPLELLDAFQDVVTALPGARLSIVGDGLLRPEVERAAASLGEAVTLHGRLESDQLSAVYREADILIHPGIQEVWGLVINEALAHGLYVIASDQVGSAYDLLDESSGRMIPALDRAALVTAMIEAGRDCSRALPARARRAERVAACTPAAFAGDVERAARLALARRHQMELRPASISGTVTSR